MMRFHVLLASTIGLLFLPPIAQGALVILGNLPATNDNFSATVDDGSDNIGAGPVHVRWAISFTMPAQTYSVDHVALRLREYNTTSGDVASVGFYEDSGTDRPGNLVGNLLVSPLSTSSALGQFNFAPGGELALSASTKYWLLVDAAGGDFYSWQGSVPSKTPTSQIGSLFGKEILLSGDTVDDSGQVNSFEIVAVPEPPCCYLLGSILGISGLRPRQRGR